MDIRLKLSSLCLSSLLCFCLFGEESKEEYPRPMRVVMRHIESGGIGYNQGYTTLEGFFSPSKPYLDTCIPFLDLRGHLFNNGKAAANAGAGIRYLASSRVWGWNTYYDYRKTHRQHYNQVAGGFECLGKIWDFRLNGYFPVGKKRSHFWGARFAKFEGNYAFISGKKEFVLAGGNAEAAAHVRSWKNVDFTFAGGPYYLSGFGKSAWGGEARVVIDLTQYCRLEGRTSYDHLFHWTGQGQLSLIIPFGGRRKIQRKEDQSPSTIRALALRAVQPVERFEIIPVDRKRKVTKAIDPSTGKPYFFLFVNNTSHSNGTYESPFNTLATAQSASSKGDIIYVFPGDGTSTGMNTGIALKDNQQLLGAGTLQTLPIIGGVLTIPPQANANPNLTAPAGSSVVTVANNNTISGFQIATDAGGVVNGSYAIGSFSGTTANLVVSKNILTVNNGALGVSPNNPSGRVTITENTIQSTDELGAYGIYLIQTGGDGTYNVSNNIVSDFKNSDIPFSPTTVPSGTGIAILAENQSTVRASVSGNQINNSKEHALDLRAIGTGTPTLYAIVESNQLEAQGGGIGMFIFSNDAAVETFRVLNNTCGGYSFGVIGQAEGTSRMVGGIQNNTLSSGISGSGIIAETNLITQSASATGIFAIQSNTVSSFNAQGIATAAYGTSTLTAIIQNNTAHTINKAGLFLIGHGTSKTNLFISNNILHNNNGGMEIDAQNNSIVNALVQGNTVFNNNGAGIAALPINNGTEKFSILSNVFYNNNLTNLDSGSAVTMVADDSSNICLRMLNNLSTDEATQPDYFLQNAGTGVFNVEPLAGNTGTISQSGTTPVPSGTCSP